MWCRALSILVPLLQDLTKRMSGPQAMGEQLLAELPGSAAVMLQKFALTRGAALLVRLDAQAYRAASFLDDRVLSPSLTGAWVSLERAIVATRSITPRPLHFIFHAGHVGSTLLSRLIEEAPGVMSLREPLPLRTLAELHDVLASAESLVSPGGFDECLEGFLRLWGRGFANTTATVVKATSSASRLAPVLLQRRPAARAVFLNLQPEPYVVTLIGGTGTLIDLRGHGPERVRRLQGAGVDVEPIYRLSLGELAAMAWLAEAISQSAAEQAGGSRVLSVDFDGFLTNVGEQMTTIANHFGFPVEANFAHSIAQSSALSRYSKGPEHAYSPETRRQILEETRQNYRDEIKRGMIWLDRMAGKSPAAAAVLGKTRG